VYHLTIDGEGHGYLLQPDQARLWAPLSQFIDSVAMEVCKNKSSGVYFVFIDETDDEKCLLVIPSGEIKLLESSLFDEIEEIEVDHALNTGQLTRQQLAGLKRFIEEDSLKIFGDAMSSGDDISERFAFAIKNMSYQQRDFVIQELIRRLEKARDKADDTKGV